MNSEITYLERTFIFMLIGILVATLILVVLGALNVLGIHFIEKYIKTTRGIKRNYKSKEYRRYTFYRITT